MKNLSEKNKKRLWRILISALTFAVVFTVDKVEKLSAEGEFSVLPFALYLVPYLVVGYDVLLTAARNIARGKVFDEKFLTCIASLGAFAVCAFPEAVAVTLFYQVGEFFQAYAVGKSRESVSELMNVRPDSATLLTSEGIATEVSPEEVNVGDLILVLPGEKIPLDGVVEKGASSLDAKALTGESELQEVTVGDDVLSGVINVTGELHVRVTKAFYDSTVSKILELVENASAQKSEPENFITKFAKVYTPVVVISALLLAFLPLAFGGNFVEWVKRSLNFLVVSCPCALVVSVPLSYFSGIGKASKLGILIKGSAYIEELNRANVFVFDKTGTLTKGEFVVTSAIPYEENDRVLRLAAIAESKSNHPVSRSITKAYSGELPTDYVLEDVAGEGIIARGKSEILCGNLLLMNNHGIKAQNPNCDGTFVHVAENGEYVGCIVVADVVREDAKQTVSELKKSGAHVVMLTGDNENSARAVAQTVGVDEYVSSLLPQNKVGIVEKLLGKSHKNGGKLCFVGDGVNDAPVLVKSDIGVAMGGIGSDAAIEASDFVIMHDDLSALCKARKICSQTCRTVRENVVTAIGVKIAVLVLSALGMASTWLAIFADVGVLILCVLNAMRLQFLSRNK